MSTIERVEVHVFAYQVPDLGLGAHPAAGVGNMIHQPGSRLKPKRFAVKILCDDGASGEYDGRVPVPDGPGLGVRYDWQFIEARRLELSVFD